MLLVLNCGSQSIKYQLFQDDLQLAKKKEIKIENKKEYSRVLERELNDLKVFRKEIKKTAHRVVHGGDKFNRPIEVTGSVLKELEKYNNLAPLHNPYNILGIKIARKIFPQAKAVAVFDTGFYRDIPIKAFTYPLPENLTKKYGLRRFGFHGISHEYAAREAAKKTKKPFNQLKIISCHLGGGCSITAIKSGRAIDTSMGFTPLEGLVMMTRGGDIDPGIILKLADKMSLDKLKETLNNFSGMKGICGISEMKKVLLAAKQGDEKAKLALDIFAYRVQKYIGSYFAVLGGCHLLVFTGSIGFGSEKIRRMISGKLTILKNTKIMAIETNEELLIAKKAKKNMKSKKKEKHILPFKEIGIEDVPLVGGKNASLGEMRSNLTKKGVNVPDGFALTSQAYWHFMKENNLEKELEKLIKKRKRGDIKNLQQIGQEARKLIRQGKIPADLKKEIMAAYRELSSAYKEKNADVAIRSSGIAEDAPTDSFAGQFETFLNVKGEKELMNSLIECLASSFNDRVIVYREEKGISHLEFALSVGVQKMARSDLASAGIIFTLDTETGFRPVVLLNSIWGLGEMIVKGQITPDEFYVFKPTLKKGFPSIILKNLGRKDKKYIYSKSGGLKEVTVSPEEQLKFSLNDKEILKLAEWAVIIEDHYGKPQDIEWAKDGQTGQLFIVQSRPETVHAQSAKEKGLHREYKMKPMAGGEPRKPVLRGVAVGDKIGQGKVKIIPSVSQIAKFKKGEVLVTKMTDPDWVSIFPMAAAIVTEEGGKTCHASIVSRELGIPAIVGVKGAMKKLKSGQEVTVDCTSGLDGKIFAGKVPYEVKEYRLEEKSELKAKITLNVGTPETAFKSSFLPNGGVGLARQEFIIAEKIKVHPLALYHFDQLKDQRLKKEIEKITVEHRDKKEYFVKELAEGVAQIAAAFYPKEVIVRFSDFKTNEYRNLIGGHIFEGEEENPMMGFRGACRYLDSEFRPAFKMECQAIKRCLDEFGLKNISVMVPFCRTPQEGKEVVKLIRSFGLKKTKVYVMAEIPANVILAEEFLDIFDGMSIGSNDLTQLVLGLDRDNAKIAHIGDERNEAVKEMIRQIIKVCRKKKKYVGICGQAPSDFPEFAEFLIKEGIESISLNPDSVIKTILALGGGKKKAK